MRLNDRITSLAKAPWTFLFDYLIKQQTKMAKQKRHDISHPRGRNVGCLGIEIFQLEDLKKDKDLLLYIGSLES